MKKAILLLVAVLAIAGVAYYAHLKVQKVQDSTAFYNRAFQGAEQIANETKNQTALNIVAFLSKKIKLCEPNVDSLLALPYDVKDTLYVCPVMQEDNAYIARTKYPEIFEAFAMTDMVYVDNIMLLNGRGHYNDVSDKYLGMLLLHSAYLHGGGDDISALEFQSDLISALGKNEYQRLFDLEYLRLQKNYADDGRIQKPDTSVTKKVDKKLAEIFGTPKLQREADYMNNIFWISCAFKVYDNQQYYNPEVGKIAFLQDLNNGWD